MFPLSRPARPILATCFLAGAAILPTLLVVAWIWSTRQPGQLRGHEVALGVQLNASVEIEAVTTPTPSRHVYTAVVIRREVQASPGSRLDELARADRLVVDREGRRLVLRADMLRLNAADGRALADELLGLAGRLLGTSSRVELIAPRVELGPQLGRLGRKTVFTDLACVFERSNGGVRASASFRPDTSPGNSPARCELVAQCGVEAGQSATDLRLSVPEGECPIDALSSVFDGSAWFGPAATFSGELRFSWTGSHPAEASVRGTVREIDLSTLVAGRFPGRWLEGPGALTVERASWGTLPDGQGRGWNEAAGRLDARGGRIGQPLVDALVRHMGFLETDTAVDSAEIRTFGELVLRFELRPDGELRIRGAAGTGEEPGLVLTDSKEQAMLREPAGAPSVRGLWKAMFAWNEETLVPATAESHLLKHLPLPRSLTASQRATPAN